MEDFSYRFLNHNKNKCIFKEKVYIKDRLYHGFMTFRCCIRGCRGKLHILFPSRMVEEIDSHNSVDHKEIYVRTLIREQIFILATTTEYHPVQIFDQLNKLFSQEEMKLFSKKGIYMQIYTFKKKCRNYSGNYDIPIEYTKTLQNDNFLLYDSGMDDESRYVIFGTRENLNHLKCSPILHADGTFKIAPKGFTQVYIIYYRIEQKIFPAVYCYLTKKDEQTYYNLFKTLTRFTSELCAKYLIVDMEKAAINAFKKCFPNVQIFVCLFHLGQAWWRNIQANGLSKDYNNYRGLRQLIRQITSLAFVPSKEVFNSYKLLFDQVREINDQRVYKFYSYFGKNYVENDAAIPIGMWNAYERVLNNIPLTNNQVEAFNNNLNFRIYTNNISFVDSLKIIITLQNEKEILLDKVLSTSENVIIEEKLEKMKDALRKYGKFSLLLYLSTIGSIYSFKFNKN